MASAVAALTVGLASPSSATQKRAVSGSDAFFHSMRNPTKAGRQTPRPQRRSLQIRASSSTPSSVKEQALAGLTAAALAAALVIPDVAEAAQPGLSPSLKNFLLSIVAGGVVLSAIGGAVIAVSNFDPVKRS
ncbi:unnamed protein product [Musa acuminata subsp. malaccensis]|uniref:(wild Malaysian banana) hypothetical protein n=1 Tax=Musa acuminata subsp. malaccensis TaxID=214687 RepID=A0A804I9L8_MUSAM|nr:PREDICTED: uncharacterized protein LOC103977615 [Musa acuminata subsp. malaccensis]CAG1849485.1 unnamed protein product [Musa acuminata subsp. malaccensis]